MNFLQAKTNLCQTKLNTNYADVAAGNNSLFAITDIDDAINFAIAKIIDYKLWPFTEGKFSLTNGPWFYEAGFEFESAFLAIVGGVPWIGQGAGKRNFTDYMKWFADYPTDTSMIWTEYGGELFFNQNAFALGAQIDCYGKFVQTQPYVTPADDAQVLSIDFDNQTDMTSANEALILLAYAYLLSSEKKKNPAQAAAEEKRAYMILDTLWGKIAERKAQLNPQNRPFFNTGDFFPKRRTRFDTNIGNFP